MTEQLYRRCPVYEDCKKGYDVAHRGDFNCGDRICFQPVPPQPSPYSPEAARKYFEAQIETVPWLKALGLNWGNPSWVLGFESSHWPYIVLLDNQIVVQPNGNSLSKQVYAGAFAIDAWSAFIKEVDKVYPGMCIEWLNKKDASVGWERLNGHLVCGNHDYPAFDLNTNKVLVLVSGAVIHNATIAGFYEEYRRQHPVKVDPVYVGWHDDKPQSPISKMREELNIASEILRQHEERVAKLEGNQAVTTITFSDPQGMSTLTERVEKLEEHSKFMDTLTDALSEKVKVIDMEQNAHCELLDGIGKRLSNHISKGGHPTRGQKRPAVRKPPKPLGEKGKP
jgi:hypothetical protein